MVALLLTIQAQSESGASASDLSFLNTLGIGVFLIGVVLLLLFSTHYYRMRDLAEKRKKRGGRRPGFGDSADILQLQYMSRDELKEMILKEREERLKREAAMKAQRQHNSDTLPLGAGEPEPSNEPPPDAEVGQTVPPKTPPTEAELLARMVMPAETESEEETQKREPPKHRYSDQIERSLSSHESLEEFRKKSRKV
jgi:hypothetical protein